MKTVSKVIKKLKKKDKFMIKIIGCTKVVYSTKKKRIKSNFLNQP